ncbi:MAG: hypothetical protein HBSAPP01_06080 [Candidatus Brocadia sapporoensis]|nr:MAG: hypothetical protein HBSAPP01_06080 [Candidatus Brocadia sapporoensis]
MVKGKLIKHIKVAEDSGNIIEVRLWQVNPSPDKPHGYKYSFVYIVKGKRVIGYDNAEGKGDHRHYEDKEEVYTFKNVDKLFREEENNIGRV